MRAGPTPTQSRYADEMQKSAEVESVLKIEVKFILEVERPLSALKFRHAASQKASMCPK